MEKFYWLNYYIRWKNGLMYNNNGSEIVNVVGIKMAETILLRSINKN